MPRHFVIISILIATAIAAAIRLPALDERPMHTDEAVHAYKFDEFWKTGDYVYDPFEYHGPTLYYFTWPIMWLNGGATYAEASETNFRLAPALFGIGLILLLPLIADGLGRIATVVAGLIIAVSPAMTFFSRYYIQEPLLTFFEFAMIACGWRYVRSRKAVWACLAGVSIGLMHASKETCLISWAAAALAVACVTFSQRRRTRSPVSMPNGHGRSSWIGSLGGVALIAILVSVMCFSTFFQNWQGPVDSLRTYQTYFHRAGTEGLHIQPWYYFLKIFSFEKYGRGPVWTELFVISLAAVGGVAAFGRGGAKGPSKSLARFLTIYALFQFIVYSAIRYKTPWCMLQFFHPLCLLAGFGADWLFRKWRAVLVRGVVVGLLLIGIAHLAYQSYLLDFRFSYAHRTRQPYIYAHTVGDIKKLTGWIARLTQVHQDREDMLIKVIAEDAWPLPWYLRRWPQIGYWESVPDNVDAPVIVVAEQLHQQIEARQKLEYRHPNMYGIRPGGVRVLVYVQQALFDAYVAQEQARTAARRENP